MDVGEERREENAEKRGKSIYSTCDEQTVNEGKVYVSTDLATRCDNSTRCLVNTDILPTGVGEIKISSALPSRKSINRLQS